MLPSVPVLRMLLLDWQMSTITGTSKKISLREQFGSILHGNLKSETWDSKIFFLLAQGTAHMMLVRDMHFPASEAF